MDIPPDLLRLRVDFLRADRRVRAIADALPTAHDIINGRAQITQQQADELKEARAEGMALVLAMHRHPWLSGLPTEDRAAARKALQDAAIEAVSVNA